MIVRAADAVEESTLYCMLTVVDAYQLSRYLTLGNYFWGFALVGAIQIAENCRSELRRRGRPGQVWRFNAFLRMVATYLALF